MVESLDDLDDNRVRLATGVDGSSVTMPLPLDEQQLQCLCLWMNNELTATKQTHRNKPNTIPQEANIRLIGFSYKSDTEKCTQTRSRDKETRYDE